MPAQTFDQAMAMQLPPALEKLSVRLQTAVKVYGMPYQVFRGEDGGALYVTDHGLPLLRYLDPACWYHDRRYTTRGRRLTTGTGTVYRVNAKPDDKHPIDLVVKFSRFAQDVPLDVRSTFDGILDTEAIDEAKFLDPFKEFGRLRDLRRGRFGPPELRIWTKRPLAIYRAPQSEPAWRLGRSSSLFDQASRQIIEDQGGAAAVELEIDHTYVLLYHWVLGMDLRDASRAGLFPAEQVEAQTLRVAHELAAKGFRVLDHKPEHIITRPKGDGVLMRRGKLAYCLVDFELLERTPQYSEHLRAQQK